MWWWNDHFASLPPQGIQDLSTETHS
jgi:hypothetical protein